jgi:hypothetical protein
MSQGIFSNIVPSTTSGNQLATLLNSFKDAVVSGFSGTSRPSALQAAGYWIDTTNDPTSWDFKIYTGTLDITVFTMNLTTGLASIANADTLFEIAKISEDSVGPILRFLKQRVSGGGQTKDGDTIAEIQLRGTRDDGVEVTQARIRAFSSNDVTSLQQGAYITFEVTTENGASVAEVMRVIDGRVAIGTTVPDNALHVKGNGARVEKESDDAVGPKVYLEKKRIAGSGQTVTSDVIGTVEYVATDNTGAEVPSVQIEASVRENQTSGAQGSKLVIRNKKTGQSTFTDQITIAQEVTVNTDLIVTGDLTVNGTTTTLNTATLDVEDSNVQVNTGGTQATANSNKAGLRVDVTDGTDAQLGYDSTKASKFVIGQVGSESEVITAGHTQTMTSKTLTSPVINSPAISTPSKLDVKQDTEANLTTYAATASNGQWCFATDTKVMYQVIDSALVPAGAGGGGTTLNWNDSGNAPTIEFVDGFKLAKFDNTSNQELYAILTVPSSYRPGKPIKLKAGQFFNASISGNVLIKAATALITGTNILGTYSNIHTSTNTQVAVPGVANTIKDIGDIQLTDSSGLINGVSVLAGHKLRIRLYRDNTNETSGAANESKLIVDSFEPTFS